VSQRLRGPYILHVFSIPFFPINQGTLPRRRARLLLPLRLPPRPPPPPLLSQLLLLWPPSSTRSLLLVFLRLLCLCLLLLPQQSRPRRPRWKANPRYVKKERDCTDKQSMQENIYLFVFFSPPLVKAHVAVPRTTQGRSQPFFSCPGYPLFFLLFRLVTDRCHHRDFDAN